MPKPKAPPLSLAPTAAMDAPLPMSQRRAAVKRYYLDGEMKSWTVEQAGKFLAVIEPAVQAAQAVLLAAGRSTGAFYLFEQRVDGKPVTGMYVDERGTELETFNPERMAAAFMACYGLHNEAARDKLTAVFAMLKPAQRNKLMLQSANSAGDKEPLLDQVRRYAEAHLNTDGGLLTLHLGKPTWGIRQTPPDGAVTVTAEHEEDTDDE